jgi:cytochrome o ubiquinol oxidase operon protein cyoD
MNRTPDMIPDTYFDEIGLWPHGTSAKYSYVVGFILSLVITLGAYFLATHFMSSSSLWVTLAVFAVAQFVTQVICFIHVGAERASRDRLIIFACAALVVFIIMSGSLWIMTTLNSRMMPDMTHMEAYMSDQDGGI